MFFDKTFQNIRRAREIIAVLMKYGFEDVVTNTALRNFVSKKRKLSWVRQERPVFEYSRWERVRMVCEELGPTFIKLAQVLSNRPDILPDALITEFQKLQSEVPPFSFDKVQAIVKAEMKKDIPDVFEYFQEKPIGSASIGQVHRARLKNGDEVVVKVQRPEVEKQVATDLAIMREVARRGEKFFENNGIINVIDVVHAFERSMQKELDYTNEARNIETFRKYYKDNKRFYAPKAYKALSTKRCLVLEFVRGCKITDVQKLTEWGLDPAEIAETGLDIYLTQIFEHGFFHADPHPGNVLVDKDGTLCLIDFGMVGKLMPKDKYAFAWVLIYMSQQNAKGMAESLRKLAIDDNISDMRALEYDLNDLIEDFALLDVDESDMAELSARLQEVIYRYRIRVPGGVFIILRALAILEGIGKMIHPNFNAAQFIEPYGKKLLKEQYSATSIGSQVLDNTGSFMQLLGTFPTEMRDILIQTRKGKTTIQILHKGYNPILNRLDRMLNRFALTLIIAALIIGASITVNSGKDFSEIGYVTYIGFLGVVILGIILVYAVLRSRRQRE